MRRREPDPVEVIKQRPVIETGVVTLRKPEIGFGSESEMRRDHEVAAEFSESPGHPRRVIECAIAERVNRSPIRTEDSRSYAGKNIQTRLRGGGHNQC